MAIKMFVRFLSRAICLTLLTSALTACSIFASPQIYDLDESANGSSMRLRVGDTVRIALPADLRGGYDWQSIRGAADMRVVAERSRYVTTESGSGQRVFTYRMIGPGKCGISLEYKKLHDRNAPAEKAFQMLFYAEGKAEEAAADPADWREDKVVPVTDSKGNREFKDMLELPQ